MIGIATYAKCGDLGVDTEPTGASSGGPKPFPYRYRLLQVGTSTTFLKGLFSDSKTPTGIPVP